MQNACLERERDRERERERDRERMGEREREHVFNIFIIGFVCFEKGDTDGCSGSKQVETTALEVCTAQAQMFRNKDYICFQVHPCASTVNQRTVLWAALASGVGGPYAINGSFVHTGPPTNAPDEVKSE